VQVDIDGLGTEERTREIARMLGGIEITDQSLAHAREMLTRAEHGDADERTRRAGT
jgi:DNA repair protein RecN (Recombination protein N)